VVSGVKDLEHVEVKGVVEDLLLEVQVLGLVGIGGSGELVLKADVNASPAAARR